MNVVVAREFERRLRQPAPAGEEGREPDWLIVWRSAQRALLLSDTGHFMVFPHPGRPFTC
jgi:hypothetical protein